MKNIVIIGAGEFQNPLILKAKELGYTTHVFAWEEGAVGKETTDFFYPISIVEKEQILTECQRIRPEAVVSIASEVANLTVQYLSEKLGLTCNSRQCLECSTNKYKMRCAFQQAGLKTPAFRTVADAAELGDCAEFHFPVIVKPTDRSGSRGIFKVSRREKLDAAIRSSVANSFEKKVMVEEYLDGPEYSCESISWQGEHHMLAITKKYTTGSPHFIETGHMEPSNLSEEMCEKVRGVVYAALDALGVRYGASHSEFRVSADGSIGIIEIGSRMGGDCIGSDLVYLSTGMDFLKMVIDVAAGRMPDLTPVFSPRAAAVRFVFGQEDLDVLNRIREKAPEALYRVSKIQPLSSHTVVDSGTRFGHYILSCGDAESCRTLSELC